MNEYRNTIENLARHLNLPLPDQFSQDWEYEVADSSRVADFLESYESSNLNAVEKSILLNIILASYNDAIGEGKARPQDWELISRYLTQDRASHQAIINSWALPDEIELENCFPITSLIRKLIESR